MQRVSIKGTARGTADSVARAQLPMNQDSSATRKTLADEGITGGEVLQDILVLHVVQLNHQMLVRLEQGLIQGEPQRRDDVSDVGVL